MSTTTTSESELKIGTHTLRSRLVVGTGKYASYPLMQESLERSGTDCITVAVRRERLIDSDGNNLLDFIDTDRYTLLPNTAGCFNAEDAIRVARLGREILEGLENPGADWVKLEVLSDTKTLLPDPVATLRATEQLVAEGFQVLCYSTDDPVIARQLKEAGATSVMPAGSPIGSGQGVLNPKQHPHLSGVSQRGRPRLPGDCRRRCRYGQRRDGRHGTGRRRSAAQHRHRPRPRPAGDGRRDAARHPGRAPRLPGGENPPQALRHGEQPGRRDDHRQTSVGRAG